MTPIAGALSVFGLVTADGCVTDRIPQCSDQFSDAPRLRYSNRTSCKGLTAQPLAEGAIERTAFVPCSTAFD